jgi:hypothetical protein
MSTHNSIYIEHITYNNGKVDFEYAPDREDQEGGRRLSMVKVFKKVNGTYTEFKRFNFSQTYFTASSGQTSQTPWASLTKRLRLDAVYEQGFDNGATLNKPPYTFEYETVEEGFPVYGSTAQDFMGYYNGQIFNEDLLLLKLGTGENGAEISKEFGAKREVDSTAIKAGSLKRITYPTGGSTLFKTEANQYTDTYTVTDTVFYSSPTQTLTSRNPAVTQQPFTVTPPADADLQTLSATLEINSLNDPSLGSVLSNTIELYDETIQHLAPMFIGSSFGSSGIVDAAYAIPSPSHGPPYSYSFKAKALLVPGHSYRLYFNSGVPDPEGRNFFYATLSWRVKTGTTTHTETAVRYLGGLRIKSITNNDGQGNVTKKIFNYKSWYFNSSLFTTDLYVLAEFYKSRIQQYYLPPGSGTAGLYMYYNYGENITFPLGSSSNMLGAYDEVEELMVDRNGVALGSTVTRFKQAQDEVPSMAPAYRSDEEWKRGQVESVATYNAAGDLLKLVQNTYDYTLIDEVKSYYSSMLRQGPDPYSGGGGVVYYQECNMIVDKVSTFQIVGVGQRVFKSNLVSTVTTDHVKHGDSYIPKIVTENFVYDNLKHLQLTRSTRSESDGKTMTNNLKYPLDYVVSTCDKSICSETFDGQLENFMTVQRSCEQTNFDQYLDYRLQATTIQSALWVIQEAAIDACPLNYVPCQQSAYQDYVEALAASQYDELSAQANTYYDAYLALRRCFSSKRGEYRRAAVQPVHNGLFELC